MLKLGPSVQDRRAQGNVGCNIYVRNLPETLTDEELGGLFAVRAALRRSQSAPQESRVVSSKTFCMRAELRARGLLEAAA